MRSWILVVAVTCGFGFTAAGGNDTADTKIETSSPPGKPAKAFEGDKLVKEFCEDSDDASAKPNTAVCETTPTGEKVYCNREGSYVVDFHKMIKVNGKYTLSPQVTHLRINLYCKGDSQILAGTGIVDKCNDQTVNDAHDLWNMQVFLANKHDPGSPNAADNKTLLVLTNSPEDASQAGPDHVGASVSIDFKKLLKTGTLEGEFDNSHAEGLFGPSSCSNSFVEFPKLEEQSKGVVGQKPEGVFDVTLDESDVTRVRRLRLKSDGVDETTGANTLKITRRSNNYNISYENKSYNDSPVDGAGDGVLQATVPLGAGYRTKASGGQVRIQWTGNDSGKLWVMRQGGGIVSGKISRGVGTEEILRPYQINGRTGGDVANGSDDE